MANTSMKFGTNLINIQGVTSDFTQKTKLNFCQAYRVNHFEGQAETLEECLLVVRNQLHKRQKRYEA